MVFKEILAIKEKIAISSQHMPKHVALTMNGSFSYAFSKKLDPKEVSDKDFEIVKEIILVNIDCNIPVLTLYVVSEMVKNTKNFLTRMDSLIRFFKDMRDWEAIHKNQVKVTVLGKWYNLPADAIEEIKKTINATKDYDSFFLNLCINYDGQEEIVDACKMIARQITAEKIDAEAITKESIKENIYTSYFLPPDLIIKTGVIHTLHGFLLWDSPKARIYFADKKWPEFTKVDFLKGISRYQAMR